MLETSTRKFSPYSRRRSTIQRDDIPAVLAEEPLLQAPEERFIGYLQSLKSIH
jgi:hypothetical protein